MRLHWIPKLAKVAKPTGGATVGIGRNPARQTVKRPRGAHCDTRKSVGRNMMERTEQQVRE